MKLTPDRIWLGTHSYTLTSKYFGYKKNIWSARRRHLEGGREEAVLVDGDQITCKSRVDT